MACGSCADCKHLDKSCKSNIIREEGCIPYFTYKCKAQNNAIRIYISEYKEKVYNWQQDSEDTQLKNQGCSMWQEFIKQKTKTEQYEQLTLF